jgi:hypothetical protein
LTPAAGARMMPHTPNTTRDEQLLRTTCPLPEAPPRNAGAGALGPAKAEAPAALKSCAHTPVLYHIWPVEPYFSSYGTPSPPFSGVLLPRCLCACLSTCPSRNLKPLLCLTFSSSGRTLVQHLYAPANALWEVALCAPSSLLCLPLLPRSSMRARPCSSRFWHSSISWLCRSRLSLARGFARLIASFGSGFPGCGGGGTTPWPWSSPVPSSPGRVMDHGVAQFLAVCRWLPCVSQERRSLP